MNKINLFFKISKRLTIITMILSAFYVGLNIGMHLTVNTPMANDDNSYYSGITMMLSIFLMSTATFAPKIIGGIKAVNTKQSYFPVHLLPISLKSKFLIVLSLISICYVASILVIFPIEMIGSWVAQTYYPDKKIIVGGVIEYMIQNRVFPLIIADACVGLLCGTLVRKQLAFLIPLFVCSFINSFYFSYDHPISLTATEAGICIIFAIICVILSYQCFKRCQPANNGFFMI